MNAIAKWFFYTAVVYGLLGMLLGLHMAISTNHAQMPTHAHIMVIGWLSFFVFGFFYDRFAEAATGLLARVHFWLAQVSLAGIIIGLALIYSGNIQYEPIAAISSIAYAVSFLLFAVVTVQALNAKAA